MADKDRELLSVVAVGHVDHGKSTVIGRLLADTGSLPEGKLAQVQARCKSNARPFEYAFLLDALKDEQAQGITIDTARCFFKTEKRDYVLSDAPGHVEFLKNMVTGAARAEAALLVIDAKEGIRENTRRHGYLLSMLGLRQVVVLVNKMDLVGYDLKVFENLRKEYNEFLGPLGVFPKAYVPICAREGENIANKASWWDGPTLVDHLDSFEKEPGLEALPLRFPVQDIYKFTENNDDRRIFAGTLETGSLKAGDEVVFHPSGKESKVTTLETFHTKSLEKFVAGQASGVTLQDELYIRPGEILCRKGEPQPKVGSRFRVNLFWLGRSPLIKGKRYKLKIGTARVSVQLIKVLNVLDASDLTTVKTKEQVDRHDVAEAVLETAKPVAFDLVSDLRHTGRFVLVDQYEIAGAGILLESLPGERQALREHVNKRESSWETSAIKPIQRAERNRHRSKFIVIAGASDEKCRDLGHSLEKLLFKEGYQAYFLGPASQEQGLDSDVWDAFEKGEERLRRLGELGRILTDAGLIFISTLPDLDKDDLAVLAELSAPGGVLVLSLGGNGSRNEVASNVIELDPAVPPEQAAVQVLNKLGQDWVIPDVVI